MNPVILTSTNMVNWLTSKYTLTSYFFKWKQPKGTKVSKSKSQKLEVPWFPHKWGSLFSIFTFFLQSRVPLVPLEFSVDLVFNSLLPKNLFWGVVTHCTLTTYFSWSIRSHVIMLEHVRETHALHRPSVASPFSPFSLFTSYLTTTYPTERRFEKSFLSVLLTHCSKSSFLVQKFNFDFPWKLSIFWGEKLVKMLWFWTF